MARRSPDRLPAFWDPIQRELVEGADNWYRVFEAPSVYEDERPPLAPHILTDRRLAFRRCLSLILAHSALSHVWNNLRVTDGKSAFIAQMAMRYTKSREFMAFAESEFRSLLQDADPRIWGDEPPVLRDILHMTSMRLCDVLARCERGKRR